MSLNDIADAYDPSTPEKDFDYWLIQFDFEALSKFLIGNSVIELGCGRGVQTEKLACICKKLEVVEGSIKNIEFARNRIGEHRNVIFHESLWQDFEHEDDASDVVFFMGLEYLDREMGRKVILHSKDWLSEGGRLHVVVPNANSLHRRVAHYMGIIEDPHELSDRDRLYGHQLVYDKVDLFNLLIESGYKIRHWEGIFLKPLTNKMMMSLSEDVIRGFNKVGSELPDYCAHIYAVCEIQ